MRLLRIFAPQADESGLGYYRRLAAANGLPGWKELARIADVSLSRSALIDRPLLTAHALGIKAQWAETAAQHEEQVKSWGGLRRKGPEAVCPACLRDDTFIRTFWEHAYVSACPRHAMRLVDRCTRCAQPLSMHRRYVEFCECGADVRNIQSERAGNAELWVAALVSTSGASSKPYLPLVEGTVVDLVGILVRTLCLFSEAKSPDAKTVGPGKHAAAPRTLQESVEFLHPLERLLAVWPNGFEAHVRERLAAADPGARTLRAALGRWLVLLKTAASVGGLSAFLQVVIRVAFKEFEFILGHDVASLDLGEDERRVGLKEAAAQLGVSRDMLTDALKDGRLRHRTRLYGTRGMYYELVASDVDALAERRGAWVSEDVACSLLEVPPAVLTSLVEAKVVEVDVNWRNDIGKAGLVSMASVLKFIAEVSAYPRRQGPEPDSCLALKEMSSRRVGDRRGLTLLLQRIAAGNILPTNKAEFVGSLQYAVADISPTYSSPVLDAGLTVQGLSKLTGWKWESIDYWIEHGFLEATDSTLRGQPCKVVMPAQLLRFTRTYVPLADLARSAGTKASFLAVQLQGLEVVGGKPLPSGAKRGGLVRLGELARLATTAPQGLSGPQTEEPSSVVPKDAAASNLEEPASAGRDATDR